MKFNMLTKIALLTSSLSLTICLCAFGQAPVPAGGGPGGPTGAAMGRTSSVSGQDLTLTQASESTGAEQVAPAVPTSPPTAQPTETPRKKAHQKRLTKKHSTSPAPAQSPAAAR